MVTDALLRLMESVVHGLLGALPEIPVPDWLVSISASAADIAAMGAGLGAWIPARLIVAVALTLLAAWLIGFGIKAVRIVASFLTLGGGSAA